jgi:hypothetical protein
MNQLNESLQTALTRRDLLPSARSLLWVLSLFGNLPLVPFAVLLWGPSATALILRPAD